MQSAWTKNPYEAACMRNTSIKQLLDVKGKQSKVANTKHAKAAEFFLNSNRGLATTR